MNTDERLDRLVERHEALTQTVELLAAMQRHNNEAIDRISEAQRKTEETKAELNIAMGKLTVTMNRLGNIVIRHEERLDLLDGGDLS